MAVPPALRIPYDEVVLPEDILHWQQACLTPRHRSRGAEHFQKLFNAHDERTYREKLRWALLGLYSEDAGDALNRLAMEAQLWLATHAADPVIMAYARYMGHMWPGMRDKQTGTKDQAQAESPPWMEDDWLLLDMASSHSPGERLALLNRLLTSKGLMTVDLLNDSGSGRSMLDSLLPRPPASTDISACRNDIPLVSVIVPVYNAEETLETTLQSLLSQTWSRIEIIAVDDASTDGSLRILETLAQHDARLKILRSPVNLGAYPARNLGFTNARGSLVTVADSDDWHHPQKIEIQVKCLVDNPALVGCMSSGFRTTDALVPVPRSRPYFKHATLSSLLIRREKVMEVLGGWNNVRFGADTEFFNRFIAAFGPSALFTIDLPLTLARFREGSLTNDALHGYIGHDLGARKEYVACYRHFLKHASGAALHYSTDPQAPLPFPVPEPCRPMPSANREFDLIFSGDFQDGKQATWAILQHDAARRQGRHPRLLHEQGFHPEIPDAIHPCLRDYLFKHAETLLMPEETSAEATIVQYPHTVYTETTRDTCSPTVQEGPGNEGRQESAAAMLSSFMALPGSDQILFDLQELEELWIGLPQEFRLNQLDFKLKLSNARRTRIHELLIDHHAEPEPFESRIRKISSITAHPAVVACHDSETNARWNTLHTEWFRCQETADRAALRAKIAEELDRRGDHRLHTLLANLSSSDEEWLHHINSYLNTYGTASLVLNDQPGMERVFRLGAATRKSAMSESAPLVSVIMPCHNVEKYVRWAAESILQQTWKNLEFIIVDDCSSDRTPDILLEVAAADSRVKLLKTPFNSGPYVAKNLGLEIAQGQYITGQDADDWALPDRIEKQLLHQLVLGQPVALGHMVRMSTEGIVSKITTINPHYPDGILSKATMTAMFDATFFRTRLGSWDNVRYGADSEILSRAEVALGHKVSFVNAFTMISIHRPDSLTNRPGSAIVNGELTGPRLDYRNAYLAWHKSISSDSTYLPINQGRNFFPAPDEMQNRTGK